MKKFDHVLRYERVERILRLLSY